MDVLVPNAACSTHAGAQLEISERAYDKLWDLNVKSTFFLIAECQEMLTESVNQGGAANILVVSSLTGTHPSPMIGVYGMTKAALDNMVKGLSQELMPDGIRINAISPGLIRTSFASALLEAPGVNPASIGTPA